MCVFDLSSIKNGDEITVKATVIEKRTDCLLIQIGPKYPHSAVNRSVIKYDFIVSHTPAPRPIEVGCTVKHRTNPCDIQAKVQAIVGDRMWIEYTKNDVGHTVVYQDFWTRID